MRELILKNKTGFDIIDANMPVVIRDTRGLIFYDTESRLPNVKRFNLPPKYRLFVESGNFKARNNPVNYRIYKLPKKERFKKKDPRNFKVVFIKNPNLVTVDWGREVIIFDESFLEKPIPDVMWAFYHECGHRFWDKGKEAEKNCDRYAENCMIKAGFNPYQASKAVIDTLEKSDSMYRKEYSVNNLLRK